MGWDTWRVRPAASGAAPGSARLQQTAAHSGAGASAGAHSPGRCSLPGSSTAMVTFWAPAERSRHWGAAGGLYGSRQEHAMGGGRAAAACTRQPDAAALQQRHESAATAMLQQRGRGQQSSSGRRAAGASLQLVAPGGGLGHGCSQFLGGHKHEPGVRGQAGVSAAKGALQDLCGRARGGGWAGRPRCG